MRNERSLESQIGLLFASIRGKGRSIMRICLIVALVLALPASFASAVQAQSAADEATIREAYDQRIAAYNAHDAEAYMAFFDDDCTSGWDGAPCLAAFRKAGGFPEEQKTSRAKLLEHIGVEFITPDIAIHRYTFEGSGGLDADGKPLPPTRTQRAEVFVRKGGKWLLAVRLGQPIEE